MSFSGAVDLSNLGKKTPESVLGHQTPDILPTDQAQIKEALVAAQRDFANVTNTVESLESWAQTVRNRLAEIGWVAFVDPFNVEEGEDGFGIFSPIVDITGKIEDTAFDFDQAIHETQHGLLDGRAGKIREDGSWADPDLKL